MTQLSSLVTSIINKYELTPMLVTICLVILAILWYIFTLFRSYSPSLPPGPLSLPIIGYLPFLGPEVHQEFTTMAHKYGPIFKFYIGSKLHVVINTAELAKVVTRDQDEMFSHRKPTVAASIMSYEGQDVTFSNNSLWRNLRKILVHEVLSNKNLEAASVYRKDEVRKTINFVYSKTGKTVDISDISFSMVANLLTTMVWNKGAKDSHLGPEFQKMALKMVEILGQPNLSDFFPILAWFDLQGIERDMKKLANDLDRVFENIIQDRIKFNSKTSQEHRNRDFLETLLELKDQQDSKSVTITQIKSLLLDVMIGGTGSIATLIEWSMTEIINNHEVMKRVHEELEEIVGVNNIVEESHLPKLKYLEATCKETLRLHPVGPILVPRAPSQDCTVGGYTIPKGCTVFINAWSIQRNPQYWDNPLEFNPERFINSDGSGTKWDFKGNNLTFIPFGSGRRVCPGIPLAEKMQMYVLASLLHSFDWSLPEGEKLDLSAKFGMSLKKTKPLNIIPSPRLPNVNLYV